MIEKIKVLTESAKYDVSCSSSGSHRSAKKAQLGNANFPGICHSWSEDGRCISLLKILMSNDCIYDCNYCVNRVCNDFPRASLTDDELVQLTIDFYRRNYIEGLFISSAVVKSPDYTMEMMISVVKKLREVEKFNGYIHMKAIPGADQYLIEKAGRLVDRMSINVELPSSKSLVLMAPQKDMQKIISPINYIHNRLIEQQSLKSKLSFVPAGQTTQVIIGATNDSDFDILKMSTFMYQQKALKRVYYSAYIPINQSNMVPIVKDSIPTNREHRLYQADWLMRFYNFRADELLNEHNAFLDLSIDPKAQWALHHLDQFPIEVSRASLYELLRVPGIGPISARRIIKAQKFGNLSIDSLKKMGAVLLRAKYFITINGKYYGNSSLKANQLKYQLIANSKAASRQLQLSLLDIIGV